MPAQRKRECFHSLSVRLRQPEQSRLAQTVEQLVEPCNDVVRTGCVCYRCRCFRTCTGGTGRASRANCARFTCGTGRAGWANCACFTCGACRTGGADCACFTCGAGRTGRADCACFTGGAGRACRANCACFTRGTGRAGRANCACFTYGAGWANCARFSGGAGRADRANCACFTCGTGRAGRADCARFSGRAGRTGWANCARFSCGAGRAGWANCACFTRGAGRAGGADCACFTCGAGWAGSTGSDRSVPGSPAVPEDPECLSAPLAPSVPFLLAVRADPEVREVPSGPVGRCPSPHRTRAPASVRSDVPSCRSSPVDRSCRSSLPSDLPENSGSSVYAEGGFAVRPCAAKYRRLCATAADCGRTSAARSFQAQACLGSPNLSQQAHKPSAGA